MDTGGKLDVEHLKARVREVPDFPKDGILFRDITPVLADTDALAASSRLLSEPFRAAGVDRVIGIESRGFIFGSLVARELAVGFVPLRKPGKLPGQVVRQTYALEYGEDAVEMHLDALEQGHRVLIVDDLIATGGTARAARDLVQRVGAEVLGLAFLVELTELAGRQLLDGSRTHSVIQY